MRCFVRIMALFAAFAYGAMPYTGMAPVAAVMAVPTAVASHGDHGPAAMDHGDAGHRMTATMAASDDGCPHQPQTMAKGHCAACLTLAADILIHDAGKPARGAEAPTVASRLVSLTAAPLDPPPRA
ncbi:hypothetical protein HGO38_05625 [Rhizobium sp. CG5]|uniref:hypothetical protein n=1 Tax=Rhizobium sp. CG5 TaxID=2726076 RepID=UPI00203470A5|nr:hypothetical protein [Rhizobium sp. CG5]MCM2472955.1 hypothetical protein [Rhizobium sp. CG5]